MATAKKQSTKKQPEAKPTAVATKPRTDLIEDALDLESEAGRGMEGTDKDSFAIPFLLVLQKNSPQCDPDSGKYIKGAIASSLLNSVTNELFDGRSGVEIVPVAYQRRFIRWGAREAGGGFKGEFTPEQAAQLRLSGQVVDFEGRTYFPEGKTVNPKRDDRLADTRNHFVLLLPRRSAKSETDGPVPAVLALASTQVKKSRQLMTALSALRWAGSGGKTFTPPTYAVRVLLTTVPEQNDKGSWHGVRFEIAGRVESEETIQAARSFYNQVLAGAVKAVPTDGGEEGSGGGEEDGF